MLALSGTSGMRGTTVERAVLALRAVAGIPGRADRGAGAALRAETFCAVRRAETGAAAVRADTVPPSPRLRGTGCAAGAAWRGATVAVAGRRAGDSWAGRAGCWTADRAMSTRDPSARNAAQAGAKAGTQNKATTKSAKIRFISIDILSYFSPLLKGEVSLATRRRRGSLRNRGIIGL